MASKTVKVEKKPAYGVGKLSVKHDGYKFTATWDEPKAMTNEKSNARAEGVVVKWAVTLAVVTKVSWTDKSGKRRTKSVSDKHTVSTAPAKLKLGRKKSTFNLSSFKGGGAKFTRDSFYPNTAERVVKVTCTVVPSNAKAPNGCEKSSKTGKSIKATVAKKILKPAKPKLGSVSVNKETGGVSCTAECAERWSGTGKLAERYQLEFAMYVKNTVKTGPDKALAHVGTRAGDLFAGAAAQKRTKTHNPAEYQRQSKGYVLVRFQAVAMGLAGPSAMVTKDYYLARPNTPQIVNTKKRPISVNRKSGELLVPVDSKQDKAHPTDRMRLQYLVNSDAADKKGIPSTANWQDSGKTANDGKDKTLSVDMSKLESDPGKHTWVRVYAWRAIEDKLFTVSEPVRVKAAELPEVAGGGSGGSGNADECALSEPEPRADGTSVYVTVGWDDDTSEGTEVSWSSDPEAWISTSGPSTAEVERDDGAASFGGKSYPHSARVLVDNLAEGEPFYACARRYRSGDSGKEYGPYCDAVSAQPLSAAPSVTLAGPATVARGKPATLSWTVGGERDQQHWAVSCGGTPLDSGEGITSSYTVDAERLSSLAESGEASFSVTVDCGGASATSDAVTVQVADPPTCGISAPDPLAAQPLALALTCSQACDLCQYFGQKNLRNQAALSISFLGAMALTWVSSHFVRSKNASMASAGIL